LQDGERRKKKRETSEKRRTKEKKKSKNLEDFSVSHCRRGTRRRGEVNALNDDS